MAEESIVTRLQLIAAVAKQLASDVERGKLWPGQLDEGLAQIRNQVSQLSENGRGR